MRKPTEGLSGKARKCIVGIAGYTPRKRHPHEAMPPENNLWKRDVLTSADMGAINQRAGSDLAAMLPSRGPFAS